MSERAARAHGGRRLAGVPQTSRAAQAQAWTRRSICFHEAGHCVAMLAAYGELPCLRVDDGPPQEGETLLFLPMLQRGDVWSETALLGKLRRARQRWQDRPGVAIDERLRESAIASWRVSLAGPAAERLFVGPSHSRRYSASDILSARAVAEELVPNIDERRTWWAREWRFLLRFIRSRWIDVFALAAALDARGFLDHNDVEATLRLSAKPSHRRSSQAWG